MSLLQLPKGAVETQIVIFVCLSQHLLGQLVDFPQSQLRYITRSPGLFSLFVERLCDVDLGLLRLLRAALSRRYLSLRLEILECKGVFALLGERLAVSKQ